MEKRHCPGRRDFEHRAFATPSPWMCRAIKMPVPSLHQGGVRPLSIEHAPCKRVDQSLDTRRSDSKNRTRVIRTTGKRSPIEIAVAGLNQRRGRSTRIPIEAPKRMEYRLTTCGRNHKDNTASAGTRIRRGTIKIAVATLQQCSVRITAIYGVAREGMQHRLHTCRCYFEDSALIVSAAHKSCAIQIAVAALNQRSHRTTSVHSSARE